MRDRKLFGRAFVRDGIEEDILITIRDGAFTEVVKTAHPPSTAEKSDALIVPGFVDVHVHGGDGADFMDADPAANERILAFHARHGTTALAATTLSASREDLLHAAATIGRSADRTRMAEGSAEIVAIHLEGPYISPERAGAQDRSSIRAADIGELTAILAAAPHVEWMMTIAPESQGAQALMEHFRDRIVFSIGHTSADFGAAAAALHFGASHFTHLFNAMNGLGHREPGVVGAALASADATAELIADGIHVHPAVLRIAANAMRGRIALVTDAMRACGLAKGSYKLYGYDVTVAEGAARLADGTLAGSVLTMEVAVKNMVELAGLPIESVIPLATAVPARVARVELRKGRIRRGYDADLVFLNNRLGVDRVLARGEEVRGAA